MKQGGESFAHDSGHGQGQSVAGRNQPAVAMGTTTTKSSLVDHRDSPAGLAEKVRAAGPDDSATHDDHALWAHQRMISDIKRRSPLLSPFPPVRESRWREGDSSGNLLTGDNRGNSDEFSAFLLCRSKRNQLGSRPCTAGNPSLASRVLCCLRFLLLESAFHLAGLILSSMVAPDVRVG
jgi:hypothetical protein